MMKVLINKQRKIIVNTLKTQSGKNLAGYIITFIIISGLLLLLSKGVLAVSGAISVPVFAGIATYGFLIIIGFIILLGLPQVFKDLYAATDLQLLFTLPIPTRNIFWMKYMQSYIGTPLLAYMFFVIPLFIYGVVTGASSLYYPVMLVTLLAVTIIGLSIAYLFNLLLIQIVPANWANEFMTVMSFLSGIFVYLLFTLPDMINDKPLQEVLLSGVPLLPKWIPMSWGSTALVEAHQGSIKFLLPFVLFLLFAVLFMILATSLVEKGFRTGWIRFSEGGKKKKASRKGKPRHVTHPVIAVGRKEWFAVKRDMREWLVFMPLVFFIIFPLISFISDGVELSDLRGFNEISWPIAQGIILFLYAMVNGMIAASSIGREGASVWILRTLPLSGRDIVLGKLWISWLMPFVLITILECTAGIFLGWTLFQFVFGIAMKAVITIGISAIGLWLGTLGAKYHPTNPQARLKFGISFLLLLASYVYLLLAFIPYILLNIPAEAADFAAEVSNDITGVFAKVTGIIATLLTWKANHPIIVGTFGVLVMLVISLGIASVFIFVSARRIDKGIEIDMISEASGKSLSKSRKSGGSLY